MATPSDVILVDRVTGRRTGSGAIERLGLGVTTLAAQALAPFHEYGFSYAARLFARVLPSRKTLRVRFAGGASFDFPYGDPYWSVLLRRGRNYERNTEYLLGIIGKDDFAFVDCGANYGYWSVRVSGSEFGHHPVVAIEAAPDTFAWLHRNREVNGNRFTALNRAVSVTSGRRVSLFGAKHEARSIVPSSDTAVGMVETISLDDILARDELRSANRIVLKLDVEGAELDAMRGAAAMLERDLLVVYEDHGSDRSHAITRHMMSELGMRIFGITGERFWELRDLDELDAVKVSRRWGYDFFASRSPFWIGRMEGLVKSGKRGRD